MKKNVPFNQEENPLYHDTLTLLKKYRDVVWSLELSVQRVRRKFQIEYGNSIEDFLDSIYLAGVDFDESGIAEHAQSIERSHKMLKLVESSVELLRTKHKNGEMYYWILYFSFFHRRNIGMQRKSWNSFSLIFLISVIKPFIGEGKKRLTLSLQSCGAILPGKV